MKVPLLDLKAQLASIRGEVMEAVTEVIDSTRYIMGPKVRLLEENIAAYCGAGHGVGVSSGTDALLAALMALGVGPGDLVLTTPYTFIATIGSILRLGAKPVFVDIDPVTYNIDPEQMALLFEKDAEVAEKIKVILPVHLFGQCADMERILALAEKYEVPVLEDAAQAIGAACPLTGDEGMVWRRAGAMGVAGCFSFFPSKNLGGIGDGGMIVSSDDELVERMRIVREHGGSPKYYHAVIGGNFRLDPLQAAVLNVKLARLPEWHKARRLNAALYNSLFEKSGLVPAGKVRTPSAVYGMAADKETGSVIGMRTEDYHIYNQYVIRVADRDNLKEFLLKNDIGVEVYYPVPLHKQKCVAAFGMNDLSFPEAEKAAEESLALPIYPELSDEMQHVVVDKIVEFYR